MNRRSFIGSILALGIAPAVARASSLMPIKVIESPLFTLGGGGYIGTYQGFRFIEVVCLDKEMGVLDLSRKQGLFHGWSVDVLPEWNSPYKPWSKIVLDDFIL